MGGNCRRPRRPFGQRTGPGGWSQTQESERWAGREDAQGALGPLLQEVPEEGALRAGSLGVSTLDKTKQHMSKGAVDCNGHQVAGAGPSARPWANPVSPALLAQLCEPFGVLPRVFLHNRVKAAHSELLSSGALTAPRPLLPLGTRPRGVSSVGPGSVVWTGQVRSP